MSAPVVKGWCPGAHRPMMSGDGLVVRVRPWCSTLSAGETRGLAELAAKHGNGAVDVTSRANLQIRGVSEERFPALLEGLGALGLLDPDEGSEARRNIVLDPFRGDDDLQDRIGAALTDCLTRAEFADLPSKFGFVVDTARPRRLGDVSGDIRIESGCCGLMVRADGTLAGRQVADAENATQAALALARWFLASGGVGADGRGRMARHIASEAELPTELAGSEAPAPAAPRPDPGPVAGGLAVGAPFGQFTSAQLTLIADSLLPGGEVRVTPFGLLYLTTPPETDAFAGSELVTAPGDPLLRVAACVGAPHCSQAEIATRDIARRLAADLPKGARAHVSGCAKGCAWPRAADLTLVGRAGRVDLVRSGTARDTPERRGLNPADLDQLLGN
ncbi:precorrin-3B synthase [Roseivivax halodurans JCM 10272]|uniref:Precorrin-3B synthase n=1 Tax=Roseivivax halodurans JCM 10272 TaxID=1449350 RepID=X7ECK3_9RHOB|nr:hypothetical protein [Roseivivax halodurans]ETX13682.1 precorrin-3B synthase [Roseivivax halodurans JCM 10272]